MSLSVTKIDAVDVSIHPPIHGEFVVFTFAKLSPSGKTSAWYVRNFKNDSFLGYIYWYGPWRSYAFAPDTSTVYETTCLRDIAQMCELLNEAQKKSPHDR